ncbi:MAG: hypothetical protein GXZ11_05780 [Tissierellia bacterium]|nr:hypothetical protein [Tissierellia bacterium]
MKTITEQIRDKFGLFDDHNARRDSLTACTLDVIRQTQAWQAWQAWEVS